MTDGREDAGSSLSSASGRREHEAPDSRFPQERRLEALVHLGALLASNQSLEEAAAQIAEYGSIVTGLPALILYVRGDGDSDYLALATDGLPDAAEDLQLRPIDVAAIDLGGGAPCIVEVSTLGSPDLLGACQRRGYRQAWVAPLTIEGVLLRGLLVGLDRRADSPPAEEIAAFRLLAVQATSAVWNAERHAAERRAERRLFDAEHRVAVTLQRHFIHPLPDIEGLELAAVSATANQPELVGGDFYDVFTVPSGRVVILLGDVEGKGVPAAGMTETVRTAIGSFALVDTSPGFMLRKTNELLISRRSPGDRFVTAFLMTVDLATGEAAFASAGHPSPAVLSSAPARFVEVEPSVPLGTFPSDYRVGHLTLAQGDCLVFFSDGVTEARRGDELFDERRLLETLGAMADRAPQAVASCLRDAALEFAGQLVDDVQILAVRIQARATVGTASSF